MNHLSGGEDTGKLHENNLPKLFGLDGFKGRKTGRLHPNVKSDLELENDRLEKSQIDYVASITIGELRERLAQWHPKTECVYIDKFDAMAIINFLDSIDEK